MPIRYEKNRTLSFDRVLAMKRRASLFVQNVLEDQARADEISDETVEAYAGRKKIQIENPKRRSTSMDGTVTKAELEETLDEAEDILDSALDAKLTREELVGKVEEVYTLIAGEEVDDEDDDDDETDDDED